MSAGTPRAADEVRPVAERLVAELSPFCTRIFIAGSLRRREEFVRDVEIVAQPRPASGLFGPDWSLPTEFEAYTDARVLAGTRWQKRHAWGRKYRAALVEDIPVDLFVVTPPASWAVLLAIRTGPAGFSRHLAQLALRRGFRIEDGRLMHGELEQRTGTEELFLAALGLDWIDPADRRAS